MISIYGEVLVDIIDNKLFIGGAPFNVSYLISKLNGDVYFNSSVGKDELGEYIIDFIKNNSSLKKYNINILDNHKTTSVVVKNDINGERSFKFNRDNTADFYLNKKDLVHIKDSNIVHLGSLMFNEKVGLEFAYELIKQTKKYNKKLSLDINLRDDLFDNKESILNTFLPIIKECDILKFSEEELLFFSNKNTIIEGLKSLCYNKLAFITLGKEGSIFYYNNELYKVDSNPVNSIDTTGAGDAFYGCILRYLDELDLNNINTNELIKIVKKANLCGAYATLKKGALLENIDENILKSNIA